MVALINSLTIILFSVIVSWKAQNFGFSEEFCISETFEPRCQSDEIVVVDEAVYGRRKLGRCLQDEVDLNEINMKDLKFIGCSSDVRNLLEPKCLGKNSCQIRVAELKAQSGCYTYLKCFLEVRYKCLKVVQDNRQCGIKLDTERQHLLRSKQSNFGCGSIQQPWIIESTTGQKIKITFDHLASKSGQIFVVQDKYGCKNPLGFIVEKKSRTNKTFCNGQDKRPGTSSFLSESNSIEIVFNFNKEDHTGSNPNRSLFIVGVEATGCSDLIPPADAWLKRTENEAIIGCYSTRLRWQLKCQGQRWIGVIGNCSYAHDEFETKLTETVEVKKATSDQTVAIITIGMSGLVASVLIGCVGVVCIKKYHTSSKTKVTHLRIGNNGCQYSNEQCQMNKLDYDGTFKLFNNSEFVDGTTLNKDSQQYFELDQALVNKDTMFV